MSDAPPRWWQRVLPVSALLVGLLAVAAVALPGVRDQLALSATHRPEPYVELSLARTDTGVRDACGGVVAFDVTSHLRDDERLAYVVTVVGRRTVQRTGHVDLAPGQTRPLRTELPRLPGRSVVTVRLRDRDQLLRVHCGGGAS